MKHKISLSRSALLNSKLKVPKTTEYIISRSKKSLIEKKSGIEYILKDKDLRLLEDKDSRLIEDIDQIDRSLRIRSQFLLDITNHQKIDFSYARNNFSKISLTLDNNNFPIKDSNYNLEIKLMTFPKAFKSLVFLDEEIKTSYSNDIPQENLEKDELYTFTDQRLSLIKERISETFKNVDDKDNPHKYEIIDSQEDPIIRLKIDSQELLNNIYSDIISVGLMTRYYDPDVLGYHFLDIENNENIQLSLDQKIIQEAKLLVDNAQSIDVCSKHEVRSYDDPHGKRWIIKLYPEPEEKAANVESIVNHHVGPNSKGHVPISPVDDPGRYKSFYVTIQSYKGDHGDLDLDRQLNTLAFFHVKGKYMIKDLNSNKRRWFSSKKKHFNQNKVFKELEKHLDNDEFKRYKKRVKDAKDNIDHDLYNIYEHLGKDNDFLSLLSHNDTRQDNFLRSCKVIIDNEHSCFGIPFYDIALPMIESGCCDKKKIINYFSRYLLHYNTLTNVKDKVLFNPFNDHEDKMFDICIDIIKEAGIIAGIKEMYALYKRGGRDADDRIKVIKHYIDNIDN